MAWNIGWGLTYACNSRCKHCYNNSGTGVLEQINLEQAKIIVDKLYNNRVKTIDSELIKRRWYSCKVRGKFREFLSYEWAHRQDADIVLLKLIKYTHNAFDDSKLLSVLCMAVAVRIAPYIVISQIDEQLNNRVVPDDINIDIDKIVWEISVQRLFAITHKDQYKTLYKLVDDCIQSKKIGEIIVNDLGKQRA